MNDTPTPRPEEHPRTVQDELLDHEYDGIQEYDNPLPGWWVTLFWITIVFAPVYILFYHFGPGLLVEEKYQAEMDAFYQRQAEELAALGEVTDEMLLTLKENPAMLADGQATFRSKCSQCHGMFGEGGIGPNLTDPYWIHGGAPTNIYTTISEGVPDKGMLTWKNQLPPAKIMAVAAYVMTLQGTSPPNAKAPQGELWDPGANPTDEGAAGAGTPDQQETGAAASP